ncbi:MAG TPA: hybrid sensor histidine kinase/response regulator, partial [Armatimonadota bacterium]|nr:hybrid sensor histidine kinase/response regulator [Armatimonadota bacterium]
AALAIDNAQLYAGERKARAAAEEADRAKDQFVALVSHELRNPLNAIQAGVGLLQHLGTSDPRAARTLEIIGRNVKLQARLVNDLLDLSRIQREKLQFQHAPVEIARMVTAAVQASASEASEAGLSLTSTVIPDLWVHGDFDRLQQVVMNLLSNAIKFTPSGGEIRVHVAQAGNRAQVIVEDTGIGIDLDQIDSLFEVFRQGEVGAQRKPGLGLGLALVKKIVERHGGHVYAESEGPGKGSRFIVDLPLVPSPGVRTPESETPAALPRTIGVLLIEDNPDTRALVADTLSLAGYDVQTAASGEDALKLLREQAHCCLAGQACHPGACSPSRRRPDIILCDIGLPGMDGFEFLRRARELPHMTEVPAFAVTGLGSEEDVRRGQESGFVCHFVKPVDIHAIDARIREWVTAKGDAE